MVFQRIKQKKFIYHKLGLISTPKTPLKQNMNIRVLVFVWNTGMASAFDFT